MDTTRRFLLAACAALALAACNQRPHLTLQQVQNVNGLSMETVKAQLGGPSVVTDAGDSVWWEYDGVITPDGRNGTACHLVFKKDKVEKITC